MTDTLKKQISAPSVIHDHILSLLSLEDLPDAERALMLDSMVAVVEERVLLRVLESLDDASEKTLIAALEKDDAPAIQNVLDTQVPNLLDMIQEETIALKERLVKQFARP